MGRSKHGMLDHDKDKVLRLQFYGRFYEREKKILDRHLKHVKEKHGINKSEWLRTVILRALIKEGKAAS